MAMFPNKNTPVNHNSDDGIAVDLYPYLRKYNDGRVERLAVSTFVPPSEVPGTNDVATRDVVIDRGTGLSVRLFLNIAAAATGKRLPLILYFHGGSFCSGSAFSKLFHRYATSLSARAGALVVSVDYRLVPEHPIPAAYEDAWTALRWVVTLSDPWLADHADPVRMFLAGESGGANIAHNVAARAATPDGNDIDIEGIILVQPYFWGPNRLPSEMEDSDNESVFTPTWVDTLWPFLTDGAAGNDDPRINPPAHLIASLPCRRALVAVASRDVVWERGCREAEMLSHSERCREVKLVESKGEDHGFHLYRPGRTSAMELMDSIVDFINSHAPSHLHEREVLTIGPDRKVFGRQSLMARNSLVVGRAKPPVASFRLTLGRSTSFKMPHKNTVGPAILRRTMHMWMAC